MWQATGGTPGICPATRSRSASSRSPFAARICAALTPKGVFTSRVNGYEIHAGEWWGVGLLDRLDAHHLGFLLLSAVYEPRPKDRWTSATGAEVVELRLEALSLLDRWRRSEWKSGLYDLTREPHFGLTVALDQWLRGASLASLGEYTSTTQGDLVRNFRLLIQFARQIRKALPRDDRSTRTKLDELIGLVDRDEVDARRQLELGQDPVEESDEDGAAET